MLEKYFEYSELSPTAEQQQRLLVIQAVLELSKTALSSSSIKSKDINTFFDELSDSIGHFADGIQDAIDRTHK
ncbi:hypothetical protein [Enterobacter kobei]|uniref:hypothetical protein n=1 Tax=Enterobacter kobei TaxID=208224 RepID=UPI0021BF6D47|nr:hypothetical protein [Enterobacter kobei]UXJ66648.1 hypothetical protein N5P26_21860 [Enterobacter kobei]